MASPDGDSMGLVRGSGSNEKVEMTRFARPGKGRMVLIYSFLPSSVWLLMSNEASHRFVVQHGAFWCISLHV